MFLFIATRPADSLDDGMCVAINNIILLFIALGKLSVIAQGPAEGIDDGMFIAINNLSCFYL